MFEQDPCTYAIKSIANKWKPHVIWELREEEAIRFSALLRRLPITERVLSQTLRELVSDGLVNRTCYAEVPPRVEYTITELGLTTIPIISTLYEWGRDRMIANGVPIDEVGEMRHGHLPLDKERTENPSLYCVDQ